MIHFKKNNLPSIILFFLCLHAYPINSQNNNSVISNTKILFTTVKRYLKQIKSYILDKYTKQYNSWFRSEKILSNKEASIEERIDIFLDALTSCHLRQLIPSLQSPDLAVAEKAFCTLKEYWPWHREYTFLISNLDNNIEESYFAEKFGGIMEMVEMFHITRQDYIAKYTDAKSFKMIDEHRKHCIEFQKNGDLDGLWDETIRLRKRVIKNGKKTILADNICLAIVEKIYRDPVSKLLHTIRYAPTIEEAQDAMQALEKHILTQTKNESINIIEAS